MFASNIWHPSVSTSWRDGMGSLVLLYLIFHPYEYFLVKILHQELVLKKGILK